MPQAYVRLSQVQQELAVKGALLQFLNPEEAEQVAELFTGLYTLDLVRGRGEEQGVQ